MYEILLTRIFSVTMWFHFAFVAVSIAMFGMTVGAILVYLYPAFFSSEKVFQRLGLFSTFLGITIISSYLAHLNIPFVTDVSFKNLFFIGLTYTVISIPFICSGICVCLVLTKFPKDVGRLYATDLIGAAIGCFLVIWILGITDASSAVILVSFFSAIAGIFFAGKAYKKTLVSATVVSLAITLFFLTHAAMASVSGSPFFRLTRVKGRIEAKPLYEKWNAFSRITVDNDPNGPKAFGWGLSSLHSDDIAPEELWLRIDSGAATPMTRFNGNLLLHNYLKYDITNLAYYLKSDSDVLIVGTGGGRDILSALAFNQRSVRGVEINEAIIDTANRKFGDFTGHLDRNPKVSIVNDEARSYIARSKDRFDVIQVSFIDTNAATAAGAFVFTENSLYTVEAWKSFLGHLKPDGILTFSRWYHLDLSGEMYRMVIIGDTVLRSMGITDTKRYMLCARNIQSSDHADVGTIMISRSPFTQAQLRKIDTVCRQLNYEVVLSPEVSKDPVFDRLLKPEGREAFLKKFPINITAPTDDNPFFFSMVRPWQALNKELWSFKLATFNIKAIFVLATLFLIVTVLTILCILVPLLMTKDKHVLKGTSSILIYFAMIGSGFMFVEISQMQRLNIFLGHPVYGLSVVLFSLLLSSGLGSFLTRNVLIEGLKTQGLVRLAVLCISVILIGAATPYLMQRFQVCSTPVRIALAISILSALGIFMGMAFPLGMKLASERTASLTPWLWGINGATSVYASVLAVIIAISFGVSVSYWAGLGCYLVALGMFALSFRSGKL